MAPRFTLGAFATIVLSISSLSLAVDSSTYTLDGKPLPADWVFGCGTSAYQIEGAWNADGKGVSIWDTYAHDKKKSDITNGETGDVAIDF